MQNSSEEKEKKSQQTPNKSPNHCAEINFEKEMMFLLTSNKY